MYLLDSDVFIDAKRTYYAFDLCPGFWDFLELEVQLGEIRSIRKVRDELEAGRDELADWAHAQGAPFFLEPGPGFAAAMRRVGDWVQAADFTDAAKRDFLGKADSFLVAHALAEGHTVVTNETPNQPNERKNVKIPTACDAVGVPCARTFAVLRRRGACFRL
jgi:hypothetical protein